MQSIASMDCTAEVLTPEHLIRYLGIHQLAFLVDLGRALAEHAYAMGDYIVSIDSRKVVRYDKVTVKGLAHSMNYYRRGRPI